MMEDRMTDGSDATTQGPDFRSYGSPLELVDRTDIDYPERLKLLQAWQADLARKDAPEEEQEEIRGAIQALEMGAALQGDDADEIPEGAAHREGPNG
jgi:hypothetical protein